MVTKRGTNMGAVKELYQGNGLNAEESLAAMRQANRDVSKSVAELSLLADEMEASLNPVYREGCHVRKIEMRSNGSYVWIVEKVRP